MRSIYKELALFLVGFIGRILGVAGVLLVAFSMIGELFLHVPAGFGIWTGGSMIVVAVIALEIMIWQNKKKEELELCQCPCGCRNKRDGLEDLCHYCMEYREDLRRDFIAAKTQDL